ncbi:MAG: hypothetical protein A2167_05680 [Planctomycetes bacterium RBG_13_46_10]|nr:MAG: hypothetical protein A2167_05680 [Planctomycetes bacterium RBG_13_46_10]
MIEYNYTELPLDTEARLGDVLAEMLNNKIEPQHENYCSLADTFERLLPPELIKHCRIGSVVNGQLRLLADSSSYMYQLQLCSSDLIAGLKKHYPRLRIKRIKIDAS